MFSDSFPDAGLDCGSIIFVTHGTPLFHVLGTKGKCYMPLSIFKDYGLCAMTSYTDI
jgi:hypothetical protein